MRARRCRPVLLTLLLATLPLAPACAASSVIPGGKATRATSASVRASTTVTARTATTAGS